MKKASLLLLCLSSMLISRSQFYKSLLPAEGFTDSLNRIVHDFKLNFYPIQGIQLRSDGTADVFQSKASLPGAAHCIIQRYHSKEDTTASWQAIMFEGENFDEALKVYKNTYRLIKKAKIRSAAAAHYTFTGEMETPDETLRFAVSPLRLDSPDSDYKNFYAEVEITSGYEGWEVHLNLHTKKSDASEY